MATSWGQVDASQQFKRGSMEVRDSHLAPESRHPLQQGEQLLVTMLAIRSSFLSRSLSLPIPSRPRKQLGRIDGALVYPEACDSVRECHEIRKQVAEKKLQDSDRRSKSRLDAVQGFAPSTHPTRPTSALP